MSRHAETFVAAATVAKGLVIKRVANVNGEYTADQATDASGAEALIGIADKGLTSGKPGEVVTSGKCWARAGGPITPTDTTLTVDPASGRLVVANSGIDFFIARNRHLKTAADGDFILVEVDFGKA